MTPKELIKTSKFLSLVLRHKPDTIDIVLDESGWADINDLLSKMKKRGMSITRDELYFIVENNDKKRFALNDIRTKIRASQGHSIEVDLNYEAKQPPETLYHGTAKQYVGSIFKTGIEKRNRQHVHLSDNLDTATKVGSRHGEVVIFTVASGKMYEQGYAFYLSDNGVWLTDHVPTEFLTISN